MKKPFTRYALFFLFLIFIASKFALAEQYKTWNEVNYGLSRTGQKPIIARDKIEQQKINSSMLSRFGGYGDTREQNGFTDNGYDPTAQKQKVKSYGEMLKEEGGYEASLVKKAEEGDIVSQRKLGIMYSVGKGLPMNKKKGMAWLQAAAAQGDESAKQMLSNWYGMSF